MSRTAVLGALAASAVLTGWLLYNQNSYTDTTSLSEHGPDMFVKGMQLDVLDKTGALQYRLSADTMNHYPGSDQIALRQPVMQIFEQERLLWHIESERSAVAESGETVNLLGEVRIRRESTADEQGFVVLTRDLLVKPDSRTAETGHRAVIESGRYTLEGTGLHADFTTHRLELDSDVKGRFDAAS
jgi:lipopolysaccharide export system protein LptC